ncbi:MAG: Na(+)/H(+) antiporter subunit C [Candidatus Binatia bacterium]|nr:Na(+)/H(+) antiporter subunit C [Candidatus Binatia bacterium]
MELLMIAVIGILFGCGTYLLLQAHLLQIIVGLALFSHGANLALMVSGGLKRGGPPLLTIGAPYADPLPQALILTAIVISFGVTAFALVLAFLTKQVCVSNDVDELAGG